MPYIDDLKAEGLTPERATAISNAFDGLHSALSKLDKQNLKQFLSLPLETRLSCYAKSEGLMDVITNR